jgi:hypothetical protein
MMMSPIPLLVMNIGARAGLGDRDRDNAFTRGHPGQPPGLLLCVAEARNVRPGHIGADQRSDRNAAACPGQLLGQHDDAQAVAAGAAVLGWGQQSEQTGRAHLLEQGVRRVPGCLGVIDNWANVTVHKSPTHRAELLVLVVKFPVHDIISPARPSSRSVEC